MKIMFHSNLLGLRGTEIALYDYALYNEILLNNNSIILSNKYSDLKSLNKFKSKFTVILYDNINEITSKCEKNNIDIFYAIKAGSELEISSKSCKNVNHIVFENDISKLIGTNAAVSEWLGRQMRIPFVPHIVNVPSLNIKSNLRSELGISKNRIVYGYYGGNNSFDITFAKECITEIVRNKNSIYFIFMNVDKFIENDKIIFLPGTYDQIRKEMFINTCDAMLHARLRGETFGLSIAEFSVRQKPIITFKNSYESQHYEILKNKALYYSNKKELYDILTSFNPYDFNKIDLDCYSNQFKPEKVMKKFKEIFID